MYMVKIKFIYRNVLPGDHVISIQHADWCWKEEGKTLKISHEPSKEDDGPLVVDFEQSGFLLACSLSHDADVVSCKSLFKKKIILNEFVWRFLS